MTSRQDEDEFNPTPADLGRLPQLPATVPTTALVLQRTQMTLGLLRDVVQETTAEYWCKLGEDAIDKEEWDQAIRYFVKAFKITGDTKINALLGLSNAFEARAKYRASKGDFDGCQLDEQAADDASQGAMYWIDYYYEDLRYEE